MRPAQREMAVQGRGKAGPVGRQLCGQFPATRRAWARPPWARLQRRARQTARDASLSVRRKGDLRTILARWPRSIGLPVTEARKAMLDQRDHAETGESRPECRREWRSGRHGLRGDWNRRSCPRPTRTVPGAPCRQISTESPDPASQQWREAPFQSTAWA